MLQDIFLFNKRLDSCLPLCVVVSTAIQEGWVIDTAHFLSWVLINLSLGGSGRGESLPILQKGFCIPNTWFLQEVRMFNLNSGGSYCFYLKLNQ